MNGPGTCIPICVCGFLLTVSVQFFNLNNEREIKLRMIVIFLQLLGREVKIIFVESICRVTSFSLSGKILYFFADQLFVQWPELQRKYPCTRYIGRIV